MYSYHEFVKNADSVGMKQAADQAESEAIMGKKMEYTDDREPAAEAEPETAAETEEKLKTIGYVYDKTRNQFIWCKI